MSIKSSISIKLSKTMKPEAVEAAKAWNSKVRSLKKDDLEMFEGGVNSKCMKCAGTCKQASFATIIRCPQYKKMF